MRPRLIVTNIHDLSALMDWSDLNIYFEKTNLAFRGSEPMWIFSNWGQLLKDAPFLPGYVYEDHAFYIDALVASGLLSRDKDSWPVTRTPLGEKLLEQAFVYFRLLNSHD